MKIEALILYIVVSLVILAGFRVLSIFLNYMGNTNKKQVLLKYLPLTEAVFWIVYLILSINHFVNKGGSIHAIWLICILLILILFFSWFAFRDVIAGIIWKSNTKLKLYDSIQIENMQGKIQNFHHRNLEVLTENEERIFIPYTKMLNTSIIKSNPTEMILSYSFTLITDKEKTSIELMQNIRIEILNLPWSSVKTEPKIKPIKENLDSYEFEINIFSMDKNYFYKIENHIKNVFGK